MALKNLTWSKWKVARTIWPYPEGWGVYKEHYFTGEKVILDTGLPKETAEEIAKQLNNGKTPYEVGRAADNIGDSKTG